MGGKQVVRSPDNTGHRLDIEERFDPSGTEAGLLLISHAMVSIKSAPAPTRPPDSSFPD
jgi:hypothetical protein